MAGSKVIIIGAGGHARVVADAIRASGDYVFGFVDTVAPTRKGDLFEGVPIVGGLDDGLECLRREGLEIAIGFGHCGGRDRVIRELHRAGVRLHRVIHPSASVSPSAAIEEGGYVGPQAVIEAHCRIGMGTIVNCGSCVCHECDIGCAVALCPGVMVGGRTVIGDRTWVGIGSTCIDKITIGADNFIGAGAVVVSDLSAKNFVLGVPARVVRPVTDVF